MKILSLVTIVFAVALAGCGSKSSSTAGATNTTSGGSLVTAPVDYLNSAVKAEQNAVKTVDTTSLNQAIQLFNVDKGRNPKDLNELVEQRFIAKIPEVPYGNKLVYDANAGKVTVVKE